jgi:hypothetical protein
VLNLSKAPEGISTVYLIEVVKSPNETTPRDVTSQYAGKTIKLKSVETGQYAGGNAGYDRVKADGKNMSEYEVSPLTSDGWVGFKLKGSNKYLSVQSGDGITTEGAALSQWECFKIYEYQGYRFLRSHKTTAGKPYESYIQVNMNGSNPTKELGAWRPVQDGLDGATWERFQIEVVGSAPSQPTQPTGIQWVDNKDFYKTDFISGKYTGYWDYSKSSGNQPNGQGKLVYASSSGMYKSGALRYEGNFVNGARDGWGTTYYADYRYEGQWYGMWAKDKLVFDGKVYYTGGQYKGWTLVAKMIGISTTVAKWSDDTHWENTSPVSDPESARLAIKTANGLIISLSGGSPNVAYDVSIDYDPSENILVNDPWHKIDTQTTISYGMSAGYRYIITLKYNDKVIDSYSFTAPGTKWDPSKAVRTPGIVGSWIPGLLVSEISESQKVIVNVVDKLGGIQDDDTSFDLRVYEDDVLIYTHGISEIIPVTMAVYYGHAYRFELWDPGENSDWSPVHMDAAIYVPPMSMDGNNSDENHGSDEQVSDLPETPSSGDKDAVPPKNYVGGSSGGGVAAPLVAPPASAITSETGLHHISGQNRVETAVAISRLGWSSSDTVILAPGGNDNLIDALAVAPLAGQEDAPILISVNGALDSSVIAEVKRLGASRVYAVGALNQNVISTLKMAIPALKVEVLKGKDRFETAALISAKVQNPKGTFIVGYNAIADAVSAASFAAANGYIIQIARPNGSVNGHWAAESIQTYILGGPALVKDIAGAKRIYGADRYDTNKALREALNFDYANIYMADGGTLVDALTGSALAAKTRAAIALAPGNNLASVDLGHITAETKIYTLGIVTD